MAFDKHLVLERWETPCSDLKSLFFVKLIDEGKELIFSVQEKEILYEFRFKDFGPYQIADEALLQAYQIDAEEYQAQDFASIKPVGRTCLVHNSLWANSFNQGLMLDIYFPMGLQHYHIGTSDSSLDILTTAAPIISVSRITEQKQH